MSLPPFNPGLILRQMAAQAAAPTRRYAPAVAVALGAAGRGPDVPAAIYWQHLVYCQAALCKGKADGWFYKSTAELTFDLAMSEKEQDRVRQLLIRLGLLAVETRTAPTARGGRSQTRWFCPDAGAMEVFLMKLMRQQARRGDAACQGEHCPAWGECTPEVTPAQCPLKAEHTPQKGECSARIGKKHTPQKGEWSLTSGPSESIPPAGGDGQASITPAGGDAMNQKYQDQKYIYKHQELGEEDQGRDAAADAPLASLPPTPPRSAKGASAAASPVTATVADTPSLAAAVAPRTIPYPRLLLKPEARQTPAIDLTAADFAYPDAALVYSWALRTLGVSIFPDTECAAAAVASNYERMCQMIQDAAKRFVTACRAQGVKPSAILERDLKDDNRVWREVGTIQGVKTLRYRLNQMADAMTEAGGARGEAGGVG